MKSYVLTLYDNRSRAVAFIPGLPASSMQQPDASDAFARARGAHAWWLRSIDTAAQCVNDRPLRGSLGRNYTPKALDTIACMTPAETFGHFSTLVDPQLHPAAA